jgi:hypothetical protein
MKYCVEDIHLSDEDGNITKYNSTTEVKDELSTIENIDGMFVVIGFQEIGTIHSASIDDLDYWEEEFYAEEFLELYDHQY